MALVICPECGYESVSNTAESCPKCGYNVRTHFEKEEKKRQLEEKRSQKELNNKKILNDITIILEQKYKEIDSSVPPTKPNFANILFHGSTSIITYITIFVFFVFSVLSFFLPKYFGMLILIFLWIPIWLLISYDKYRSKKSFYEENIDDWNGYKIREKERIKNKYMSLYENICKNNSNANSVDISDINDNLSYINCPVCGSAKIKKISAVNRMVSVFVTGLASSKLGKQYECLNCKHKW